MICDITLGGPVHQLDTRTRQSEMTRLYAAIHQRDDRIHAHFNSLKTFSNLDGPSSTDKVKLVETGGMMKQDCVPVWSRSSAAVGIAAACGCLASLLTSPPVYRFTPPRPATCYSALPVTHKGQQLADCMLVVVEQDRVGGIDVGAECEERLG